MGLNWNGSSSSPKSKIRVSKETYLDALKSFIWIPLKKFQQLDFLEKFLGENGQMPISKLIRKIPPF